MSPQFANAKAGEVGDVAGLVGERVNGWIRSYPSEATSSALKDGVLIKGRPVEWAWAIPGASEYLVVTFSDSHKQYVVRTELPDLATPAVASVVALVVAPEVDPGAMTTLVSPPSSADETAEPLPDLAFLADVARSRVYAWIRSYPLNATSSVLGDGSRVPGRPVGWAWAIPGTVEFLVVEFSDGHKQYLSPADLPESAS
jgi:hypothetical protein